MNKKQRESTAKVLKMSELSILFLILAIIGFAGALWTRHKQKQKEAK